MIKPLKVGDRVTAPSWNGNSAVIERIGGGAEVVAFFGNGNHWRLADLQLVPEEAA